MLSCCQSRIVTNFSYRVTAGRCNATTKAAPICRLTPDLGLQWWESTCRYIG